MYLQIQKEQEHSQKIDFFCIYMEVKKDDGIND